MRQKSRKRSFNVRTTLLLAGLGLLLLVMGFATFSTLTQRKITSSKANEQLYRCTYSKYSSPDCNSNSFVGQGWNYSCIVDVTIYQLGVCYPSEGHYIKFSCFLMTDTSSCDACANYSTKDECLAHREFCKVEETCGKCGRNTASWEQICGSSGNSSCKSEHSVCDPNKANDCCNGGSCGYDPKTGDNICFSGSEGGCVQNKCDGNKCKEFRYNPYPPTTAHPDGCTKNGLCTYDSDCVGQPTLPAATPTRRPAPTTVPKLKVDVKRVNGSGVKVDKICQVECNKNGKQCVQKGTCVKDTSSVVFTRGSTGVTRGLQVYLTQDTKTFSFVKIIPHWDTPQGITNTTCGTDSNPAICYVWPVSSWSGGLRSFVMRVTGE